MKETVERVVVTGCGVVSPLGIGWTAFREALAAGRCGIGPISLFPPRAGGPALAAEVRDFRVRDHIAPSQYRRMNRLSQMSVAACVLALADAGLEVRDENRDRIGIVYGTAEGGVAPAAEMLSEMHERGPTLVNPFSFPNTVMNAPPGYASIVCGFRGPATTVNHKEASAEMAVGIAHAWVRAGRAAALLAGGSDEICRPLYEALLRFRALSGWDGGAEGSRPFDKKRNGLVMGEGAAFLVLEPLGSAKARGARILAEVAGYGCATGAAPPNGYGSEPDPIVKAMRRAMAEGRVEPFDIGAVFAAANSTVPLDRIEAAAIEEVFGSGAAGPRVVAVRGSTGHSGSTGALAVAAALGALQGDPFPANLGLDEPERALNFRSAAPAASGPPRAILVNGVATGGFCITLLLRRYEEAPP